MGLPKFPIDKAFLIGCWLESAFWGELIIRTNAGLADLLVQIGFYTLLFGGSLYLIWTRRREVMIKIPTLVMIVMCVYHTSICLFMNLKHNRYILSTVTAIISPVRLVHAFTVKDASGVLHPGMFFKNEVDVLFRIQEVIYFLDVSYL